ncbi:hypothetical protein ACFL41_01575 [Gemmatimonadota bacterium]
MTLVALHRQLLADGTSSSNIERPGSIFCPGRSLFPFIQTEHPRFTPFMLAVTHPES